MPRGPTGDAGRGFLHPGLAHSLPWTRSDPAPTRPRAVDCAVQRDGHRPGRPCSSRRTQPPPRSRPGRPPQRRPSSWQRWSRVSEQQADVPAWTSVTLTRAERRRTQGRSNAQATVRNTMTHTGANSSDGGDRIAATGYGGREERSPPGSLMRFGHAGVDQQRRTTGTTSSTRASPTSASASPTRRPGCRTGRRTSPPADRRAAGRQTRSVSPHKSPATYPVTQNEDHGRRRDRTLGA